MSSRSDATEGIRELRPRPRLTVARAMFAVGVAAGILAVGRTYGPCAAASLAVLIGWYSLCRRLFRTRRLAATGTGADLPPGVQLDPAARGPDARGVRRRGRMGGVVAVAVVIGPLVAVLVWFPGRPFDPAGWRVDPQSEAGAKIRQGMADRLLASGTLLQKTRAEVVALLGEPSRADPTGEIRYSLGDELEDHEDARYRIFLVMRFGRDGRVVEARRDY